MFENDTIAAISTAYGVGGIGIIRVSGNNAFGVITKIFKGHKKFDAIKSHTINYGKIIDPKKQETIDEVLVSVMKKPNTFTKEDVVEINCHGSMVIIKKILDLVIANGARLAEPGEFSKRAFLNGRIDLAQAEAIIDIINSKTEESAKASILQLEGRLSKQVKEIRKKLIELIARIEVSVDYPEYDIEEMSKDKIYNELFYIKSKLIDIIKNFEGGKILREGLNAVIVGKPNVGKSSLLNVLSGTNKAIVTDIPGTTRDIIEEYINVNEIPIKFFDTAGIRETEDIIEKLGIQKAQDAISIADLVIYIIDTSQNINDEDLNFINNLNNKNLIVLFNKIDIAKNEIIKKYKAIIKKGIPIEISTKEEIGIDELKGTIHDMFFHGEISQNNEILITNIRHKNLIDSSLQYIEEVFKAFESDMPLDIFSIDIKNAAEYLGQITGESVNEDVLHEIFSKFCLGK